MTGWITPVRLCYVRSMLISLYLYSSSWHEWTKYLCIRYLLQPYFHFASLGCVFSWKIKNQFSLLKPVTTHFIPTADWPKTRLCLLKDKRKRVKKGFCFSLLLESHPFHDVLHLFIIWDVVLMFLETGVTRDDSCVLVRISVRKKGDICVCRIIGVLAQDKMRSHSVILATDFNKASVFLVCINFYGLPSLKWRLGQWGIKGINLIS